jgi:restriction system protein
MIPNYQTLMLPLLKYINDGQPHTKSELIGFLGATFNLTEQELNEQLPNSKNGKRKFNNRVHWAQAHLKMAGLIEYIGSSIVQITDRGRQLISEGTTALSIRSLRDKFEDYDEKLKSSYTGKRNIPMNEESGGQNVLDPEEQISTAYQNILITLKQDILTRVKAVPPKSFEKHVVELLVKMGYGGDFNESGSTTPYAKDEGIDGIIKEDKLGLDVIYIQAKRWEGTVSRPEIQKFVGALAGQRAKKGVFITTSSFTKEAINYAAQMDAKIVLIDGEQLAQYMIDYNLGVSIQNTYEIKKIDLDYFEEE